MGTEARGQDSMPNSFGYRARTRDLFSRPYRAKGRTGLTTYLRRFKVGEYVDVVANASQHKGMPHKFYHGRTGIVWDVKKRAIGVEVNKMVNTRIQKKRIHVRVEHLRPSNCQREHLARVKANEAAKQDKSEKKVLKRQPKGPKGGEMIMMKDTSLETLEPIPYVFV